MKKQNLRRFSVVWLFATALSLSAGCKFVDNVYFGFAAGLGGIPASLVGGFIADALFGTTEGE